MTYMVKDAAKTQQGQSFTYCTQDSLYKVQDTLV